MVWRRHDNAVERHLPEFCNRGAPLRFIAEKLTTAPVLLIIGVHHAGYRHQASRGTVKCASEMRAHAAEADDANLKCLHQKNLSSILG